MPLYICSCFRDVGAFVVIVVRPRDWVFAFQASLLDPNLHVCSITISGAGVEEKEFRMELRSGIGRALVNVLCYCDTIIRDVFGLEFVCDALPGLVPLISPFLTLSRVGIIV